MKKLLLPLFFLGATALACGVFTRPTQRPADIITSAIPPADTPEAAIPAVQETPTEETFSTPAGVGGLEPPGPWLVIVTPSGLWAANRDGSGLTPLSRQLVLAPQDLTAAAAPSGGHLAFLTSETLLQGLTLHILTLPGGEQVDIRLTTPESEPAADAQPGDPLLEGARSMVETTNLAWSPDGRRLAFTGSIEGPSADLYVYSLDDGSITRLTDEAAHAIRPSWSPDGLQIAYTAVTSLGTGAGYALDGVWAARADGSGTRALYTPELSGDERILGWLDAGTFLVHSWRAACGPENLRAFNLDSREAQPWFPGAFNGVAAHPGGGGVLVSVDMFTADCLGGEQGLFLLRPGESPQRLVEEDAFLPVWSPEAGLFFARTADSVLAASLEGEVTNLLAPLPALPAVSPGGAHLAWASHEGLWVADFGASPLNITPETGFGLAWTPDGQRLIFFVEDRMYLARGPEYALTLAGEGLRARGLVWVSP